MERLFAAEVAARGAAGASVSDRVRDKVVEPARR
jgi:hypothetical protein